MLLAHEVLALMGGSREAVRLHMPWTFHLRAKVSFENVYLPQLLLALLPLADQLAFPQRAPEEFVLQLLGVLNEVFAWSFGSREQEREDDEDDERAAEVVFTPTAAWRSLLVDNHNVLALFLKLYAAWRDASAEVAEAAAQCLLPLATLSGEVFADPAQQVGYLLTLLRGILHLLYALPLP